jgi:hypothetical protein
MKHQQLRPQQRRNQRLLIGGLCVASLALAACGKSDSVTKLEGILAAGENQLTQCQAIPSAERANCIAGVLTDTGAQWTANVSAAASDDPEATAALASAYTAFASKASDLVQQGVN